MPGNAGAGVRIGGLGPDREIAAPPADIDIASEFRYRDPVLSPASMAIFVSQSGETADTLAALRYMKEKADIVAGLVNVGTSSIAREADIALAILAGGTVARAIPMPR